MPIRSAAAAALFLLSLAAAPAAADHGYWPANGVSPAPVNSHAPRFGGNMMPTFYGPDCQLFDVEDGLDVYGHVLEADYGLVIVVGARGGKRLEGPNALTIYRGASAGTFVWSDADGDSAFRRVHEADTVALILCPPFPLAPPTDAVTRAAPAMPATWPWLLGLVAGLGILLWPARVQSGQRPNLQGR